MSAESNQWPELDLTNWEPTASTLHMWTQIVGKTRLALTPMLAHWWNVPLYVSARGLSTSAMPYEGEFLEVEFDLFRCVVLCYGRRLHNLRPGRGHCVKCEGVLRPFPLLSD